MPSDVRWDALAALLAPAAESFEAALAETALAAARLEGEDAPYNPAAAAAASLGPFGTTHFDTAEFGAQFERRTAVGALPAGLVERARRVLEELRDRGATLWQSRVPPGANLADTVHRSLAEIGRAFGAARVLHAAGATEAEKEAGGLVAYRFPLWTRAERQVAPPLLVRVAGSDLRPAALSDVLDGRIRIVLVVEGMCPVAPLARLVTPGTFVQQTTDPASLAGFVSWNGPGIAALVPEGAAVFTHDPRTGLTVNAAPAPRGPVAGASVSQQRDELALLARLAQPVAPAVDAAEVPGATGGAPADPAGRLAAWLIARAGQDG